MQFIRHVNKMNDDAQPAIPDEIDWGDCSDHLDRDWAFNLYFGKSNKDMMGHFKSDPIEVFSGLKWMPIVPFQYYILGFAEAVVQLEKDPDLNSDSASCFLDVIRHRSEMESSDVLRVYYDLEPTLIYVANNQLAFEADVEIYGNFKDVFTQIKLNLDIFV